MDWKSKFDEDFEDGEVLAEYIHYDNVERLQHKSSGYPVMAQEMKSFIENLLEQEKRRMVSGIDGLIQQYEEVGEMLQGESKTMNTEKIHAFRLAKSSIINK